MLDGGIQIPSELHEELALALFSEPISAVSLWALAEQVSEEYPDLATKLRRLIKAEQNCSCPICMLVKLSVECELSKEDN